MPKYTALTARKDGHQRHERGSSPGRYQSIGLVAPIQLIGVKVKSCIKCGKNKAVSEYYAHKTKDGLQGTCKECVKVKSRLWNKNNKDKKHYQEVTRRYGISQEDYFKKLDLQQHECPICNEKLVERPHVDHCHNTGKVRDLLCRCCNLLLGYSKDNEKTLQNAIKYLQKHTSYT